MKTAKALKTRQVPAPAPVLRRARLVGQWSDLPLYGDGFMECRTVEFRADGTGRYEFERPGTTNSSTFRWTLEGPRLRVRGGKGNTLETVVSVSKVPNARGRLIRAVSFEPSLWFGSGPFGRQRGRSGGP